MGLRPGEFACGCLARLTLVPLLSRGTFRRGATGAGLAAFDPGLSSAQMAADACQPDPPLAKLHLL